jgi:hypothetical protein
MLAGVAASVRIEAGASDVPWPIPEGRFGLAIDLAVVSIGWNQGRGPSSRSRGSRGAGQRRSTGANPGFPNRP